jgi:membrane-associated HD superfamily phosphohydrolase
MAKQTGTQRKPYTVSLFGQIALAAAILLYLFSTTFDPASFNSFLVMLSILIAGILLSAVMVGIRFIPFNTKSLLTDLLSTGVAFVSVWVVNSVMPASLSTITAGQSPLGPISFSILSGVAEGWFFHLWLVAWLSDLATPFIGIPASALCWAIFHIARYGGDMNMIWIIFVAGLPLGALTIYFRSNDGPVFGHMLVNALVGRS